MVKLLIALLVQHGIDFGFFRLVDYVTFRVIMAMVTALVLTLLFGHRLIVRLYQKNIRDTSGELHFISAYAKKGTPTAGGILILLATLVSFVLWGDFFDLAKRVYNPFVVCLVASLIYFGTVGFIDDFQKVRFRSSLSGLSQKAKTIMQLGFIVPFALLYVFSPLNPIEPKLRTLIYVPFYKYPVVDLGQTAFVVFLVFVFFSILNAVNLTDGLDGLLSGLAIQTIGVYGVFAYIVGNSLLSKHYLFPHISGVEEIAVVGATLIGAMLGFLWYNFYPAEVFMGDTGSLSIGSAIALMVFFSKQELMFLFAGGIFVFEIFTSLLQEKVGNRLGRRLVYRAPYHHSLTHQGIAEPKAVARLLLIALLLTMLSLLSIKVR